MFRTLVMQPEQACLISSSISKYNKDIPGGLPNLGSPVPMLRRALSAGGSSQGAGSSGGAGASKKVPTKPFSDRKKLDAPSMSKARDESVFETTSGVDHNDQFVLSGAEFSGEGWLWRNRHCLAQSHAEARPGAAASGDYRRGGPGRL